MEDKTFTDWESGKKIVSSELTNRDQLEDTRINPVKSQMSAEEHIELAEFWQQTELTKEGWDVETGQEPEFNSYEEPT